MSTDDGSPHGVRVFDDATWARVCAEAKESPRGRKNWNLHRTLDATVQRFVNVLQPGTYARPHRHIREPGWDGFEVMVVLRGRLGVLLFDDDGAVRATLTVGPDAGRSIVEYDEGIWHAILALDADTTVFEVKQGPYEPETDKDFHAAYPREGDPRCATLVREWMGLFERA